MTPTLRRPSILDEIDEAQDGLSDPAKQAIRLAAPHVAPSLNAFMSRNSDAPTGLETPTGGIRPRLSLGSSG